MVNRHHVRTSDLRGLGRLTIDGIVGVVELVEALQYTVGSLPGIFGKPKPRRTTGITGLVYRSIGGTIALVGLGLDRLLATLNPLVGAGSTWPGRETLLAVLNGVLGDYLAASRNPLAITMGLRRDGRLLPRDAPGLAAAIPGAGGRLVVLVHGLCMNDRQWKRKGHDHGAALARDLGFTPVYVHYNTGLHVSVNGRAFADLLETLLKAWPVPVTELAIVGHSMGGLVARSACHYGAIAHHAWIRRLDKLVFLGTPHHGAPLERGGNMVDLLLGISRYSAPFARLGKIRSAGITDLRYGNLLDQDWQGRDRFERTGDVRRIVPLPDGVQCFDIAATTGKAAGDLSDRLIGDGIVPLASALGRHEKPGRTLTFPESRQWIGYGMNHLDLLSRRAVYARIHRWLATPLPSPRRAEDAGG
jgi:pimeloyl-ACP methyl ester carboxylesterase